MRFLCKCPCSWPLWTLLAGAVNPTESASPWQDSVSTQHWPGVRMLCLFKSVFKSLNDKLHPATAYVVPWLPQSPHEYPIICRSVMMLIWINPPGCSIHTLFQFCDYEATVTYLFPNIIGSVSISFQLIPSFVLVCIGSNILASSWSTTQTMKHWLQQGHDYNLSFAIFL